MKIVVWTPQLDDVNGQNLMTRSVVSKYGDRAEVVQYKSGASGVLSSIFCGWGLFFRGVMSSEPSVYYLVVSRSFFGAVRDLPCLFLAFFKRRLVCHVHGSDLPELLSSRFLGKFFLVLYKRVLVLVPSPHLLSPLNRLGLDNVVVCENFVEIPGFSLPIGIPKIDGGKFNVFWNSNILASKGFFEVCESVFILSSELKDLRLVVIGKCISDEEKSDRELRAGIKKYFDLGVARFLGAVDPEVAFELLEMSSLIVLPSTYKSECQPLSIISAMLSKKTVLVSKTPALLETTRGYSNVVYCDRDVQDISSAILRLYRDWEEGRLIANSVDVSSIESRYSAERFFSTLEKVLFNG